MGSGYTTASLEATFYVSFLIEFNRKETWYIFL